MSWFVRVVVGLAGCSTCVPPAAGQEPPANPKAKVEFRWVEGKHVKGLTEDTGFPASCFPNSLAYPHRTPALTLAPADVTEARLAEHDFTRSGGGRNYSVTLHLTKDARTRLAAACGDERERGLTVVVDGRCWGVHRYDNGEHNAAGVPAEARAKTFLPSVGYFTSRAEAERLVDALKRPEVANPPRDSP